MTIRAAMLAALLLWSSTAVSRAATPRPNFVILIADDLGYGDLGSYGHPTIATPNLDRMAREGLRLTSFYVAASVCSPSRAALLTGRYPLRSGVFRVLFPEEAGGIPASEVTLAEALASSGYRTMAIGKWHLGHREPFLPARHGFDRYYGLLYSNDMDYPGYPLRLYRDEQELPGEVDQPLLTESYTREAVDFIRAAGDQPFFLYLAYTMPHVPLHASARFAGTSQRGLFGDVVETIDWSVGRVLEALAQAGVDDHTVVLFTSDNGPWLREQQNGGSAGLLREGKGTSYEGGLRVPGIVRWPARVAKGQVRSEIATSLDVLPTFLEIAGVELPADRTLDGRSLLPVLEGEAAAAIDPPRRFYYFQGAVLEAIREGRWKVRQAPAAESPAAQQAALIATHARSLAEHRTFTRAESLGVEAPPELFDLDADPGERFDVAVDHPDLVRRLLEQMRAFARELEPGEAFEAVSRGFLERSTRTAEPRTAESRTAETRTAETRTAESPLQASRGHAGRPNFVVLFADDLGYGDLGSYGHPTIATPNLDRMAREGLRHTSFYVAGPACSPSRAALLTGRYPMRSGVYRVLRLEDTGGLPPSEVTMAEALGAEGYQTLALGKWHVGHRSPSLPTENGFDHFHGLLYSNNMASADQPLRLYRDTTEQPGEVDQSLLTRSYTEAATAFIRRAGDRPFFLYLAYAMPHVPLHSSEKFSGSSARGPYGDAVQEIDWSAGEILRALREAGLDERTVVVFSSDNGPWLPRKQDGGSAGLLREGKNTTYEGGMRVPCIVRWPGRVPAGQVSAELASSLDLLPTFLELAKIDWAERPALDGRSILPLWEGGALGDARPFYYFQGALLEAVREGRWKYREAPASSSPNASGDSVPAYLAALERIAVERRSLAAFEIDPTISAGAQLFDLEADPSERFNLASEQPELARRLRAQMQAFAHGLVPGPAYEHLEREFAERARKQLALSGNQVEKQP